MQDVGGGQTFVLRLPGLDVELLFASLGAAVHAHSIRVDHDELDDSPAEVAYFLDERIAARLDARGDVREQLERRAVH